MRPDSASQFLLARGPARFDVLLARGPARFDVLLARGPARFDPLDVAHAALRFARAWTRALRPLALSAGLGACGSEGATFLEPGFATSHFDAGPPDVPPDRELLQYTLVDIPGGAGCERLPLAPGLLAPLDRSELTCTDHTQCPLHALCSARVACSNQPVACDPEVLYTWCSSDQCQDDAHCPAGFRCRCEGAQKECVEANCSADSDCAAGQRCRLTWLRRAAAEEHLTCNGDVKSYACSTAEDECTDDKDCPALDARCGYDLPRKRFACLPCGWRVP